MKNRYWLTVGVMSVLGMMGCQSSASKVEKSLPSVAAMDNSQNSLDWNGTYLGTFPCADCEGIEMSLTLLPEGRYQLTQTYLGEALKPLVSQGAFVWNDAGNTITLENEPQPNQYFVGENRLIKLDRFGQKPTGELAPFYHLIKQ
ncbi:copper resistance protein NlpE [Vibrio sp. SM6]|uniref:Copper resistance protein NlpE n=1 Tax=Vibrio agarilyticus TaxID=2726741 RepID=A0A7X8YI17_9VIBR|nr:copper resistance protein NlpE [Vibrio agarilyticus]NLS14708.1 copper resistance protein NlpE [Vibrio agarilyticus]